MNSSTVTDAQDATAAQYNNARKDILERGGDFASSGGSANAYTLSIDSQISSYATGLVIKFKSSFTNTGSATINVNSLGAKSLVKKNNENIVSGDIIQNQIVEAVYDGTNFLVFSLFSGDIAEFGDGSDGDITINSGAFSSGPITNNTLTRDAYFNNLTINDTYTLNANGFKVHIRGVYNPNSTGKIISNGNNGNNGGNAVGTTPGTGGANVSAAYSGGTMPTVLSSKAGGNGGYNTVGVNGTAGTAQTLSNGKAGANSGKGGDSTYNGGTSATGGAISSTPLDTPRSVYNVNKLFDARPSYGLHTGSASSASGGGGGGGTPAALAGGAGGGGGSSGSSGGDLWIAARVILTTTSNVFAESLGGDGGDGGDGSDGQLGADTGGGGGGGGAPGSGGNIYLIYAVKIGSGTTDVSAGAIGIGGTGGWNAAHSVQAGNGNDSSAATDGTVYEHVII